MDRNSKHLFECAEIISGYAFESSKFSNIGIPLIRISNIYENRVYIEKENIRIHNDYAEKLEGFHVKRGDILIALSGATTGKFGVYDSEEFGLLNQRIALLRPIDNSIYSRYLYYSMFGLNSEILRKACGVAQPNISAREIGKLKIPLPPLSEQKRIADLLDRADSLRQKRRESLALLDEFLKSVFIDMFGDPVRNEKGWEVRTMDSLTTKITDGEHTTPKRQKDGVKLLSARNIKDSYVDFEAGLDYVSRDEYERIAKRCNPEFGDILMSCSGSVGRVARIRIHEPFSLVRSVALLKLKDELINGTYLEKYMQTAFFQYHVKRNSNASSQSNIFTGQIRKLPVLVPKLALQNKFSRIVTETEKLRFSMSESLIQQDNQFNVLLQRAFRGEGM